MNKKLFALLILSISAVTFEGLGFGRFGRCCPPPACPKPVCCPTPAPVCCPAPQPACCPAPVAVKRCPIFRRGICCKAPRVQCCPPRIRCCKKRFRCCPRPARVCCPPKLACPPTPTVQCCPATRVVKARRCPLFRRGRCCPRPRPICCPAPAKVCCPAPAPTCCPPVTAPKVLRTGASYEAALLSPEMATEKGYLDEHQLTATEEQLRDGTAEDSALLSPEMAEEYPHDEALPAEDEQITRENDQEEYLEEDTNDQEDLAQEFN